jgi:hypothetical protein
MNKFYEGMNIFSRRSNFLVDLAEKISQELATLSLVSLSQSYAIV